MRKNEEEIIIQYFTELDKNTVPYYIEMRSGYLHSQETRPLVSHIRNPKATGVELIKTKINEARNNGADYVIVKEFHGTSHKAVPRETFAIYFKAAEPMQLGMIKPTPEILPKVNEEILSQIGGLNGYIGMITQNVQTANKIDILQRDISIKEQKIHELEVKNHQLELEVEELESRLNETEEEVETNNKYNPETNGLVGLGITLLGSALEKGLMGFASKVPALQSLLGLSQQTESEPVQSNTPQTNTAVAQNDPKIQVINEVNQFIMELSEEQLKLFCSYYMQIVKKIKTN